MFVTPQLLDGWKENLEFRMIFPQESNFKEKII
jgi:hypothetical protein